MHEGIQYVVNFLYAAILAGVPLMYGTLGEVITQKAGNLNLGVEGMMYLGAVFGFWGGYATGSPAAALLCAFAAGMGGALLYALLTVSFKANQNVTGLTLTIFGTGIANYIGTSLMMASPTKSASVAVNVIDAFRPLRVPLLSDIPYLGKLIFSHSWFVYLGVILCVAAGFYLNHTRQGLNLRAVGENAAAADAVGIPVTLYKYAHIGVGGGICGLGGAYVALVTCGGTWTYNCINGLGWIAVALVIFAAWSPYRVLYGSLAFGALSVLRLYIPGTVISVPPSIFSMLPFLATIVVLVITSIRLKREKMQPRGCGVNYFREER